MDIPILTTWMSIDLLPEDAPSFCGRPGLLGQRAANIIQQKASHLYILGARLDGDQTAYNLDNFAPRAEKTVIDVDQAELDKLPGNWNKHRQNLRDNKFIPHRVVGDEWLQWCKALHNRLDVYPETPGQPGYIDPFAVANWLSEIGKPDDIFAIGSSGQAPCTFLQAFKVKAGQRVLNLCTYGAMGADIPMAIGACIASGKRRTICVTGDGGFMLNVHELEVVRRMKLPIKFLVYNNDGYNSIRQMQRKRFDGRLVAEGPGSGFTTPEISKVAKTFDIDYEFMIPFGFTEFRDTRICSELPLIYEIYCDPEFVQYPRVDSSMGPDGVPVPDPMEDMTPKLPRDEFERIMEH